MPIKGARYRFVRTKKGKAVRLAFKGKKVVEVRPYKENKAGILKPLSPAKKINS